MELKDFIKGTITDIATAIKELNEENNDISLFVNPRNFYITERKNEKICGDGRLVEYVDFNLSISASDKKETGGKIAITVLNAGLQNEYNNSTVSTIKFSIPIIFPGSDGPTPDRTFVNLSKP